ncbi:hypothetical protein CAS74_000182 [Pichia kudriavzevii]|uniref:TauD/TfdA-like domain-containing protein n=1 Tax=Pichia kudriavzevii TaxID=4909 RepID=A0A1Z8JTP5_PICKU|nr:hypothetical protein CAS74_000182 [Pichia kudriavzevii]
MATKTQTYQHNTDASLTVHDDVSIDKQIEKLIRSHKELSITRSNEANINFEGGPDSEGLKLLPASSRKRIEADGLDISKGYPEIPPRTQIPIFGKNADPEKKALLGAAKEVIHLTKNVGTEIDELALLVAERVVVFFRDQKLPPTKQHELGSYLGNIEYHAQVPHVTGLPGATVIWNDYINKKDSKLNFANANLANWDTLRYPGYGNQGWHTDLVHEHQPAGYTHLHLDAIPSIGGDTIWSSDEFKKFLDGKKAVYVSSHAYLDREDPLGGPKKIERVHPLVRTHPATGWKSLYVNRGLTKRIIGVSPVESDLILNYLFDIYEKNADIQVRFKWSPTKEGYGTSAIWDNRISQHRSVWDNEVTSLAEVPFFDPESKSQREALGKPIHKWD